jgi:hypothetical protein
MLAGNTEAGVTVRRQRQASENVTACFEIFGGQENKGLNRESTITEDAPDLLIAKQLGMVSRRNWPFLTWILPGFDGA